MLKLLRIAALVLPFLAGLALFQRIALADGVPVTMQLVGDNDGFNMGGVYTSPYQINVTENGVTTTGLALACDDFTTDITFGDTWNADMFTLSDVALGGPQKFPLGPPGTDSIAVTIPGGGAAYYTIQQSYDAAAWLAEQLLTIPANLDNSEIAGEYSYAIWQIFDPAAVGGYGGQALTSTEQAAVATDMANAFSSTASLLPNYQVYIFTPNPVTVSQEFIGVFRVPEGSTVALLAFNFLALAGIILSARRRFHRAA